MTAPLPDDDNPLATTPPRVGLEIVLLLALSLGRSAIYSILQIVDRLTRPQALNQQTSTLNPSVIPDRPWLDLIYQLAGIGFALVPALLAIHLLNRNPGDGLRRIGFDHRRPGFDAWFGVLIAAGIGIPGLGLYLAARAVGINTQVQASALTDQWWTIPILILSAAENSIVEEVIMIGYLFTRLAQLNWTVPAILITSALVRGSYHLYQGFGGFIGNLIMGVVFGLIFLKWRRVAPLVVAHLLLDVVAFVGYSLVAPHVDWL